MGSSSPTEITTALTDLFCAAAAVACAFRLGRPEGGRASLWRSAFLTSAAASLLGAAAHGLSLSPALSRWAWRLIYACLAATVALAAGAAAQASLGRRAARWAGLLLLAGAAAFWALTTFHSDSFGLFVAYEAAGLGFALALLVSLARRGRAGAAAASAGLALFLLAGAVQASGPFEVRWGWPLDHNGVFHLVQLPAFFLLAAGARRLETGEASP
ncbi:MAG: DUF6962 family protein [Acidobacteriota bacterium]